MSSSVCPPHVHDPDSAVRDRARLVRNFETNVARPEQGAAFVDFDCCAESVFDSSLFSGDLSSYVSVHLKSSLVFRLEVMRPLKHRAFRV